MTFKEIKSLSLSLSVVSQVEPVGSVGNMFGDVWWRPEDQEEDLCEDLNQHPVLWATC